MITKIAIPKFHEKISPCFETASYFMICEAGKSQEIETKVIECTGCEGFGRIRLLQDIGIDVLICNGIKGFYLNLLESSGVAVIDNVSIDLEDVIQQYMDGKIKPVDHNNNLDELSCEIPHEDLVCWAKELFESHGFNVTVQDDEEALFPIDLIAEIKCPVCKKIIKIAICCGAHTYRADQEIREFHHVSPSLFQSKIFVFPGNSLIRKRCRDYDIQLIDPDADYANHDQVYADQIPLVEHVIPGHEKAFAGNRKGNI